MVGKKGRYETSRKGKKGGILILLLLVCVLCAAVLFFLFNRQEDRETPIVTRPTEAVTKPTVSEMQAEDHYAPVIQKYRSAISEGWTKEQCQIEGISTRMEAGGDFSKAGYAFLDLDGDGREELIIAEESLPHMDNIWDLYTTLEDGTPIQLWVDERDGGQCKLCEDNVISISDAYNDELEQTFYDLQAGQLVMREMLQWEDEDTVFHTDASGNTRQVTSREGQNISCGYETQKLELVWLVDMPDELRNAEPAEQYLLVLEKYRTALREKWDMQLCSDNDISLMISNFVEDPDRIGAHPLDLDGDGLMELIITDGMMIYDLYTLKDGSPVHLITGWERNSYQLCLDNIIYNRGSNGAASSVNNYHQLRNGELVLVESVVFDANKDFDNPWFRSSDGETPEEPLTEAEANAIMDSYPTISFLGIDLLDVQ